MGNEASGSQSVTINLGAATSASTTITYRVAGSAALDGDYRITSITSYNSEALTITVPAGESTASINFEIIDDEQIERNNEVIYFESAAISDAYISEHFRQASYSFEIEDNDVAPEATMQIDLAWNLGDGMRINGNNFDLFLADSVTLNTDGTISDYQPIEGLESVNETGFETIRLNDGIADMPYYVIIKFVSGTDPAELSLQFNSNTVHRTASGRVSSAFAGRAVYYGPFTKSGSSYAFR